MAITIAADRMRGVNAFVLVQRHEVDQSVLPYQHDPAPHLVLTSPCSRTPSGSPRAVSKDRRVAQPRQPEFAPESDCLAPWKDWLVCTEYCLKQDQLTFNNKGKISLFLTILITIVASSYTHHFHHNPSIYPGISCYASNTKRPKPNFCHKTRACSFGPFFRFSGHRLYPTRRHVQCHNDHSNSPNRPPVICPIVPEDDREDHTS